jgi:hypothetical protein
MLDSNGSDMDPQPRNKTQIKESKLPETKEIRKLECLKCLVKKEKKEKKKR